MPLTTPSSTHLTQYIASAVRAGCPQDQVANFIHAQIVMLPCQLRASAAARLCDLPGGPTQIGYGGARGGGKSHWLLAQLAADDCIRMAGLKALLLRKVGKANIEHMADLRTAVLGGVTHDFSPGRGIITLQNGSRIIAGHFQKDSDIDSYLGIEYDVVAVEEATGLSLQKYQQILTCCRSSKAYRGGVWRPRAYATTNPGG